MIALLGMDDKSFSDVTKYVNEYASDYFKVAMPEKADAFIVDFDTESGIHSWHHYCSRGHKAAIILSTDNPAKTFSIWVAKPVNPQNFESAIVRLVDMVSDLAMDLAFY